MRCDYSGYDGDRISSHATAMQTAEHSPSCQALAGLVNDHGGARCQSTAAFVSDIRRVDDVLLAGDAV